MEKLNGAGTQDGIWSCILRGARQIREWNLAYQQESESSDREFEECQTSRVEEDTEYLDRAAQMKSGKVLLKEPAVEYDPENKNEMDRILLNEQIGKIIKSRRDERGLSQDELGLLLGMNRKRVGLIESGQTEVTVPELIAMGRVFGCHPWELCPREVIFDGIPCPPEIREAVRTLNRWIEPMAG